MEGMTMDLFADTPDASGPSASNDAPKTDYAPVLAEAFAASGRKAAMKALAPEQKEALVSAVAVVAAEKRAAYRRAVAGEFLTSFDWIVRQPALASATALLNHNFIDSGIIPMAPERAPA